MRADDARKLAEAAAAGAKASVPHLLADCYRAVAVAARRGERRVPHPVAALPGLTANQRAAVNGMLFADGYEVEVNRAGEPPGWWIEW